MTSKLLLQVHIRSFPMDVADFEIIGGVFDCSDEFNFKSECDLQCNEYKYSDSNYGYGSTCSMSHAALRVVIDLNFKAIGSSRARNPVHSKKTFKFILETVTVPSLV